MSRQEDIKELVKQAIDIIGSITLFANKTNVSYKTALDWKHGRRTPSALNAMKIENVTEGKIKAKEILPGYPWEDLEKKH